MERLPTPTDDFYFPKEHQEDFVETAHSYIIDKNNNYVNHFIDQTGEDAYSKFLFPVQIFLIDTSSRMQK